MTIPEKATEWAVKIANDPSHGYDQNNRWGPDYDCSSLVISAYKHAGVPLTCTYTGNMRSGMMLCGFVTIAYDKASGNGLQVGDVLLNERSHTAMYIGNGQIVQASQNEKGGITGGQTGDQTGGEINIRSYYNFPWDMALRYIRKEEAEPEPTPSTPSHSELPDSYTVQKGDTLWGIAERFLGSGDQYIRIMSANNMVTTTIYPGEVLIIPNGNKTYKTIQITITADTYELLTIMADGWNKTIGQCIDALMEDAI